MKIVVSQSRRRLRQRWHFVIVAENGETVATSENYVRRIDAVATAERLAGADLTVES